MNDHTSTVQRHNQRRALLTRFKKGDLGPGCFDWFMQCREHGQNWQERYCGSCDYAQQLNEEIWKRLEQLAEDKGARKETE